MIEPRHLIVIGAQRSGTTSLYGLLDAHPDIYMAQPMRPEPKFFLNATEETTLASYKSIVFPSPNKSAKYLGEKSTSYYERSEFASLIHKIVPEVKLIMQLRNPTERAISNYYFSKQHGLETRSLSEVFLQKIAPPKVSFKTSVDPFNYLGRSDYLPFLKTYGEYFDKDQLLVLIQEEWDTAQQENSSKLFSFLDLDIIETQFEDLDQDFVNESERDEINKEVVRSLNKSFAPKVEALEEYLDHDLSIWKD